MKLIGLTCLALVAATSAAKIKNPKNDRGWKIWKRKHGMKFNDKEERRRHKIFQKARQFVRSHNARFDDDEETYTVALNKFAAMTESEFAQKYLAKPWEKASDPALGITLEYHCPIAFAYNGEEIPDELSYTAGNPDVRVTNVKDQGSCGSCWTFGAGAAVEAALCGAGEKDCSSWNGVSTQQFVDCASNTHRSDDPTVIDLNPYDNGGCNGGFPSNALRYVVLQEGIENWDDYGYVSGQTKTEGTCAYDATKAIQNPLSTCGAPAANDETQMAQALAQVGPLAIGIDAGGLGFQMYSGGVYTSNTCSSTRLNHAVTATGYGSLEGEDYFEVKNSWGTAWGDNGYILIARNAGNMCGVAADASYAVV